MQRFLFLCMFILFPFLGHAQKTAIDLNDELASVTDSLFAYGQAWGNKFVEVSPGKEFKQLEVYRKKADQFIDKSLRKIRSMKDIGNSKTLRMAMIDFLTYEKEMVTKGFTPAEKLSSNSSQDEINTFINNLTLLSSKESEYLDKVRESQKKYASENGFTIEETESDNASKQ